MILAPVKLSGVYTIRNRVTGRVYVGESGHIERRIYAHFRELGKGTHHRPELQADWDRYGRDQFAIGIVAVVEHEDEKTRSLLRLAIEEDWIRTLRARGIEVYNGAARRHDNHRRRRIVREFWEAYQFEPAA
jgi:group I intron endonuclease